MLWAHFWDDHGVLEEPWAHFGDVWDQFWRLWADIWDPWELLGITLGLLGLTFGGPESPKLRKIRFRET